MSMASAISAALAAPAVAYQCMLYQRYQGFRFGTFNFLFTTLSFGGLGCVAWDVQVLYLCLVGLTAAWVRVSFCSACLFVLCVFLFFCSTCFLFLSRKRCNSRKTCPGVLFLFCILCGNFQKKTETFLKSVNICRFFTGKRQVVCKKHYNLCFLRQESYTAHAEQRKKRHAPGRFLFLLRVRSPPPRSLTRSLTLGSLAEIAI